MITNFFLVLSWILMLIGFIGIYKNRNTFSRLLIVSLIDTVSAISIMLALIFYSSFGIITVKLIIILVLLLLTNPVTIHAITRAYYIHNTENSSIYNSEDKEGNKNHENWNSISNIYDNYCNCLYSKQADFCFYTLYVRSIYFFSCLICNL